jgi:poly(3-hydroxybutyrate) depolymerase
VPTWNAGNCCGCALENGVDDIGFLRARREKLESDYAFERKRMYFTGISNGGDKRTDHFQAYAVDFGESVMPV